ncbi:MAG: RIP metalloprotease RseP [Gemmatimonadales bacterium]
MSSVLINVLALIVVLGVLVFVHELGHFIAAKWAGIYVHRFSLGLGPPIRRLTTRRGETEYSISWLPLGGYVKMASREEDPTAEALEGGAVHTPVPRDRVMEAKPVWKRMIVILAGVAMNALFAWLVFSGLNWAIGLSVYPVTTIGRVHQASLPEGAEGLARLQPGDRIVRVAGRRTESWEAVQQALITASTDSILIETESGAQVAVRIHRDALEARTRAAAAIEPSIAPVIGQVTAGRPASRAGVEPGDTIVSVNGDPIGQWRELVEAIESRPEQEVTLVVGRADGRRTITARTIAEETRDSAGQPRRVGKLGLGPRLLEHHEPVSLGRAVVLGARQTATVSTQIVRVVRGMFSGRVSTREVGGPIAIGVAAGESAQLGLPSFLAFMATISVNLAVLNLLPIPVLDGGQFLFLLGEAVLRRPLSPRLRERLVLVGLILLVLLMVLAFSNDIRRLIGF